MSSYDSALNAQKRTEFFRSAGSLGFGVAVAIVVSLANLLLGPWETVSPEVVAQVIPVLLIAVVLEGDKRLLPVLPRNTGRGWRFLYRVTIGSFFLLLMVAEGFAIIDPETWCSEIVSGVQVGAIAAGLSSVVFGVGFNTIGAVLPIDLCLTKQQDASLDVEIGVSNRFRAETITPLLNFLVPSGCDLDEIQRDGTAIPGSNLLPTKEEFDFTEITEWCYLSREFGITAGDNRVGYFRVGRSERFDGEEIPVVIRFDHQDLAGGRMEKRILLGPSTRSCPD